MDYPLAIAIALPASSFIVMCGSLVGKAMNKSRFDTTSSPPVSRKVFDDILNKKFENVRYVGECKAISEGIRNEMALTREVLKEGFESLKKEIRSNGQRV